MAERRRFEYRVASYVDDPVRFEPINFGLILQDSTTMDSHYILTDNDTSKVRGLLTSSAQRKLFKATVNFLSFELDQQRKNEPEHLFRFLDELDIKQLRLSKSKPALSDDYGWLLEKLADVYIGKQFLAQTVAEPQIILPKVFAERVVSQNEVPKSHYRSNFSIQPEISVPVKMRVDYIYANSNSLEIVNSAPTTLGSTTDYWYYRMRSLGESEKFGKRVTILGNSKSDANSDHTLTQMVQSLRSLNSNFKFVDVSNPDAKVNFEKSAVETMKNKSSEEELQLLLA